MQWWHVEPLWFANTSSGILWFTYVKGFWRTSLGSWGNAVTFKTTLKGSTKLLDSTFGDLWMPVLCFILLVVSFIKGCTQLVSHMFDWQQPIACIFLQRKDACTHVGHILVGA